MQLKVPLEVPAKPAPVIITPPTSSSSSSDATTPNREPRSNNSSLESVSLEETPPRKVRTLREIYESCAFALMVTDPTTYKEAAETKAWQNAMEEEILAIQRNKTWELVDLPERKNTIGLKWIFKTKYNADGSIQKHKAQLVAKGYSQLQGVDFDETFSPVA
ncbi:hypothetical protein L6164_008612 [Bauhinia variegata]|uniref:Uncharacterized protein n=1 Tax=Bauhinia variegata TaxID=167791 RepID=A0ACB9PH17_BAUVA|nr:hypothetical protein L6164_008612 [Bauhinia variegata]